MTQTLKNVKYGQMTTTKKRHHIVVDPVVLMKTAVSFGCVHVGASKSARRMIGESGAERVITIAGTSGFSGASIDAAARVSR